MAAGILKRILSKRFLALTVVAVMSIWSNGHLFASQSLPVAVAGFAPKGWQIFDKVKQFTPENLYEQINGRASFFLAYDMIRMAYVSFVNNDETAKFINLSIYDMGTPTNAFGVFSAERSQGESPLNLGRAGYRSDANYFIWKGRYYIQIIGSEATDEFQQVGMNLARKVTDFLPDSGEQVWGLAALPLTDRIPESVQYIKVDAMGLDFMRNTYTADYQKGKTIVTVFLSKRDAADSAQATVVRYARYAKKYGKGIDRMKAGEVELVSCDMGGSYDVVFHKGRLIGGVTNVEERGLAIRVAIEMWEQLRLE
jgi:hypothetical protein